MKKILKLNFSGVFLFMAIFILFSCQNEKKESIKVLEKKNEKIHTKVYGQDSTTQKIIEWLSHPIPTGYQNYLAPILVVPELYKNVENMEVKNNVLYISINVNKGFKYLNGDNYLDRIYIVAWYMMENVYWNMWMITTGEWQPEAIGYRFQRNIFNDFSNLQSIVWEIFKYTKNNRLDKYGNRLGDYREKLQILQVKLNRERGLKQNWGNILQNTNKFFPIGSLRVSDPQPKRDYEGAVNFLLSYLDQSSINMEAIKLLCYEYNQY